MPSTVFVWTLPRAYSSSFWFTISRSLMPTIFGGGTIPLEELNSEGLGRCTPLALPAEFLFARIRPRLVRADFGENGSAAHEWPKLR